MREGSIIIILHNIQNSLFTGISRNCFRPPYVHYDISVVIKQKGIKCCIIKLTRTNQKLYRTENNFMLF